MEDIIYTSIADHLMSSTAQNYMDSLSLPRIASVALFNNQYKYEKQEIAYGLPAVFLEFGTAVYKDEARENQTAEDRIRIHVEQKNFASTEYNSHNKDIALEVLKVLKAVNVILSSLSIPAVGKLYRVSREIDTDHGNAPVHIFEYAVSYLDCSTDAYREYIDSSEYVVLGTSKHLVQQIEKPDTEPNGYIID